MNAALQFLTRLGIARVAAMGVVSVLLLGFFGFLVLRASAPQMAPLYTGLSLEDSAAIVSELQSQNIAYELRGDGDSILVPRDAITGLRMTLAQGGLPSRGQVGYEIFDQQNTLGATSFVQNINNVRALEGELSRTITSLARIKSARVHLVLPERELFRRERKDPSASIVLSVRGELTGGEIRAIQHLVAAAIEGLVPTRVSIVDDTGKLLASGTDDSDSGMAAASEERTLGVENRLRTRIEDILANVVGAGRSRVQVTAELDLNRSTKTSEIWDPDSQVVRSTQTRELQNAAKGGSESGAVSVSTELPGAADNASGAAGGNSETQSTAEETINYEISKTVETAVVEGGSVKRLSVAVAVDGIYQTDAAGTASYQPRSADELAQITSLVRSAIGFDATRGDQVEVVNLQFAERPDVQPAGTAGPGLFDFTRDDLMQGAQMLVTLVIALALVLFVMRPLLRRVLTPEQAPLALSAPGPSGVGGIASHQPGGLVAAGGIGDALAPDGSPLAMDPSLPRRPRKPGEAGQDDDDEPHKRGRRAAWVNNARTLGESQLETLKTVGELIDDNPRQAAMIVRDWLNNAA